MIDRRDFVRKTSIVSGFFAMTGLKGLQQVSLSKELKILDSFAPMEQKQILDLFQEISQHADVPSHLTLVRNMLEPKKLLSRSSSNIDEYETIYQNRLGQKVTLKRRAGQNYVSF